MNAPFGPVSTVLEEDLRAAVSRSGLLVWLDADDAYTPFVDALIARRAVQQLPYDVKAYRGSHLELMLALGATKEVASGVDKPALVIHMPGFNEETIRATPVLELYLAGARYRKSLDTLIGETAAGIAAPEAIEEFRRQKPTLARADAWLAELAAAREVGLRGTLRLIPLRTLVDELLRGEGIALQIAAADNLRAVWAHLEAATGLPASWREELTVPQASAPRERARRLADEVAFAVSSWALAVEYVDDLRRETRDPRLAPVRALPRAVIDACRGLAEHLRRAQPDFYRRTAEETEELLQAEVEDARAEDLGRIDTFEFEEKKVYEAALSALAEGRWKDARTWALERLDGSSFWIELRDSLRKPAWELVLAAATLEQAIAAAGPSLAAKSPAQAVERYTARGAAVDEAHRALEQRWHAAGGALLPERETLRARVARVRELWHAWADAWAREFSALCRAQGFLPPPALQQRTLFEDVVRPMTTQPGTTVLFLVDALRYEMAEELRRELGEPGATTIELRARLAELPTDTAIGMNALAPVADRGKLRLAFDKDGKIAGLSRGECVVSNPETRRRAIHDRVGGAKCPQYSLEEILRSDVAKLSKGLAGAKLVIVHAREIDDAGEKGVGLAVFAEALRRLRAAWNLLREAGARRFVVTADHGFLLLDDAYRQAQSHGRKIDPGRRYVLSPLAADHPGEVRVPLSQLDYEDARDLQLMMPEGTAVFDVGRRPLSFVHGGGSLQERVIPVLTIVHRTAGAGGDALAYALGARALEPVMGAHSISARVEAVAQHALDFGGRREVELSLRVLDADDVQVDILQTRGGATLRAGAIVATVGAEFEVLFQLTGPVESRVRVELYHPTHEVALEGLALDERFSVSAAPPPRAAEAESGESPKEHVSKDVAKETHEAAPNRAWLQEFTDPGVREVFAHLEAHGVVTEDEAARMLGGPRALRRFSNNFESYVKKAPFLARIDTVGGVKRYVREGQK